MTVSNSNCNNKILLIAEIQSTLKNSNSRQPLNLSRKSDFKKVCLQLHLK